MAVILRYSLRSYEVRMSSANSGGPRCTRFSSLFALESAREHYHGAATIPRAMRVERYMRHGDGMQMTTEVRRIDDYRESLSALRSIIRDDVLSARGGGLRAAEATSSRASAAISHYAYPDVFSAGDAMDASSFQDEMAAHGEPPTLLAMLAPEGSRNAAGCRREGLLRHDDYYRFRRFAFVAGRAMARRWQHGAQRFSRRD